MGSSIVERFAQLVRSMYWTWPTGLFFAAIVALLIAMTILEVMRPTVERKGLLPIPTTRGDRLFIGLLGAAWIHLGWLALLSLPLWGGSLVALAWLVLVMRFG